MVAMDEILWIKKVDHSWATVVHDSVSGAKASLRKEETDGD